MKLEQVVARARRAVGHGCIYRLGKGGFQPEAELPFNVSRECDCSGFAAWCLGVSRLVDSWHPLFRLFPGTWLETSAIVADAEDGQPGGFLRVERTLALPGHLYVFGDRKHDGIARQGHIAVISAVGPQGPSALIHCSAGNFNGPGRDAIQETPVADYWLERGAIVVRAAHVELPA